MVLPVSKTSWHCCGSQNSPALWLQNKASGAGGRASEKPAGCSSRRGSVGRARSARPTPPRHAARPEGRGRLTAGWQVAPGRAGLRSTLRKLVCPSGSRVPRAVGAASPAAASPRPAAAAPWAACQAAASILRHRHHHRPLSLSSPPARSCHGPGMQTSGWEQKAPLGPGGGEPSSLALLAARSPLSPLAGSAGLAGALLPLPAAPPRLGSPAGSPGAPNGEPRGGGQRRSRGGGREKERPEPRGRGWRRRLEAEASKEELLRGCGREPGRQPGAQQAHAPHAPWPEGKPRLPRGRKEGSPASHCRKAQIP